MSTRDILVLVRPGSRVRGDDGDAERTCRGQDPVMTAGLELLAQQAEARWFGSFFVEPRAFVAYLAARVAPSMDDAGRMQSHGADLYLACGCALGIPEAVRLFEALLAAELRVALGRMQLQPSAVDEIGQMTREKLLVGGAGRAPRIAEYTGRGTLRSWTRVVITRIALNWLRDEKREVPLDEALLDQRATDTCDPELSCLRDRFGPALDRALECAMRSLTASERVLLRQRFVDDLTSEQLARLHRKHRITMVRRIQGILRALRARTVTLLANQVGCGTATAISIVNLALSQAHLSIGRHLAPDN
jgi:RNA polymerase sigma-70 factor (ECF subfamily)